MDKATLLAGLKIIKTAGAYAHVVVNWTCFNAVRGTSPALPFATMRDADNNPVRVFDIEGTKLYTCFKRGDATEGVASKTTFIMKAADAAALGAVTTDALEFSSAEFAA